MAKYGNIINLLKTNDQIRQQVEEVLTIEKAKFKLLASSYYVETTSKRNTGTIIKGLNDLAIPYLFIHLHNSDGSVIYSNGVADEDYNTINNILIQ